MTLANWQDPPFNRWAFQHVRELIPTARIPRGDGPAWPLPRAERDCSALRFGYGDRELTVAELLERDLHRRLPGPAPGPDRHRAVLQRHGAGHPAPADVGVQVGDVGGGRGPGRPRPARRLGPGRGHRAGAGRHLVRRARPCSTCWTCGPARASTRATTTRGRRAHLRAGVPVAARTTATRGRADALALLRHAVATTARTAARSATARSSPTCWPG